MRTISLRRRLIIDLMRASMDVPFITLSRTLDIKRLAEARASLENAPGWAAIFTKAFSLVAKEDPVLRTLYIGRPWPHFYELPRSVGMVAIARTEAGEDCVLMQKVAAPDELPLDKIDAEIRYAKTAPVEDVPAFRKSLRASGLPWPLNRLIWTLGLHIGRQRANYFGSFGITSVSAIGAGQLHALSPGPFILTYGVLHPDKTIDVLLRWDHRVTDAALIAAALERLQTVLNTTIAAELTRSQPLPEAKAALAVAT
ncbi:MAG: acyltransferase [Proteobacteria bacterium]|nr:acyltransferase [Pseudomonadota bacterium]